MVNITNMIVTNTFAFIKFIFINELDSDNNFDLKSYVNKGFFVEVFLALVDKQVRDGTSSGKSRLGDSVKIYRQLIAKHKNDYCIYAKYTPPKLVNSQQIALYECTKIETAYFNNIRAHYSNRLNMILNHLCGKKEKSAVLQKKNGS